MGVPLNHHPSIARIFHCKPYSHWDFNRIFYYKPFILGTSMNGIPHILGDKLPIPSGTLPGAVAPRPCAWQSMRCAAAAASKMSSARCFPCASVARRTGGKGVVKSMGNRPENLRRCGSVGQDGWKLTGLISHGLVWMKLGQDFGAFRILKWFLLGGAVPVLSSKWTNYDYAIKYIYIYTHAYIICIYIYTYTYTHHIL